MKLPILLTAASLGLYMIAAACSGTDTGAAAAIPATGSVIEVKMITDEQGNRFEPAEIQAKQGDVLRFVLVNGIHNGRFAAQNGDSRDLPAATPMLQDPGRTADVPVTMPIGEYNFHCDPHAMLGMVGKVTVH